MAYTLRHPPGCLLCNTTCGIRRQLAFVTRASASTGNRPPPAAKRSGLPNEAEDLVVSRTSFVKAYMEAQYNAERIEGLQEFAAAVWDRRKRIPSTSYNDPLRRLFSEFDQDGDGHLTAEEIAYALQSRGVKLTPEVAQKYIDAADVNSNHQVEYDEFEDLLFRMAKADLTGKMERPTESPLKRGKSLLEVPVFQYIMQRDPSLLQIPGLQEFASSVWDRQRRVPLPLWNDPLTVTFKEFDRDGDGHLTAEELVAALNTHGVDITLEQADIIIQAVDTDDNGTIELEEFPQLIYGLAALDRASNERTAAGESGG